MRFAIPLVLLAACGAPNRGGAGDPVDGQPGGEGTVRPIDAPMIDDGCAGIPNCYSVYAHSNDTLYVIDLTTKTLETVGKFGTPNVGNSPDVITDLAVAPDGSLWVISETQLYSASSTDAHVTARGSLSACGMRGVALTFTPDGKLYEGDFVGKICEIDLSGAQPVVKPPVTLSNNLALSGDIVAVGDGTVFGTLYKLSDTANQGTQLSNLLGKINLATGQVTQLGASGYPKLFGTSYAHSHVIGFSHDGTGDAIEIDPTTGAGTVYATFLDPVSHAGIAFSGAGVNALVPIFQ
jgi:hypothetical protein